MDPSSSQADLAQPVERRFRKAQVVGSNPTVGSHPPSSGLALSPTESSHQPLLFRPISNIVSPLSHNGALVISLPVLGV